MASLSRFGTEYIVGITEKRASLAWAELSEWAEITFCMFQ